MQQLAEALEADNASVVIKKKGSKKRGDRERRPSITKCVLVACLPSAMQGSSCGGSPPRAPHCTVAMIIRACTAAEASVTRLYPLLFMSSVVSAFFLRISGPKAATWTQAGIEALPWYHLT
jgi:hypothetical protein